MAALLLNWEGRELTFLKENVFIGFQVALGSFGISKVKLWDRKAYVSDPCCSPGLPVTLSFSAATCPSTTASHTPSSTATQPWTSVGLHLNFCFASFWSRLLSPWLGRALPLSCLTALSATWFSDHCLLLACWIPFSSLPLCLLSCLQSIQTFFTLILLLLCPPWQIPSMACNLIKEKIIMDYLVIFYSHSIPPENLSSSHWLLNINCFQVLLNSLYLRRAMWMKAYHYLCSL